MTSALVVRNLGKTFGGGRTLLGRQKPSVCAVEGATFSVARGETLGIVGESGCGKSTLARMLAGLLPPTAGTIEIEGRDLSDRAGNPAAFGRLIQYVFQDPISSLNPRKTIRQILEAPLVHLLGMDAPGRKARIAELLDAVHLRAEFLDRYPHEFSGGQAQRIGIARALAAAPRILILDEPVSALDVSVQAQVLNLLADLRSAYDLTYLFISHDLAVVEAVSDRIAVLYFGRIVEMGPADKVFGAPRHPYTKLLEWSTPTIRRPLLRTEATAAELPDPLRPPPGCAFAARCPRAEGDCRAVAPAVTLLPSNHEVACHHPLD
ncbi:MAG: ATP-binding cassette domain-containing protein [Chromatiales bacterium]|nr:ATP-binding cassette domain-containing protein [Chromatiales bacterium]